MVFLIGIAIVFFVALSASFFLRIGRSQGMFGLVKLILALGGILSGAMWMFGPSLNDGDGTMSWTANLLALPWGGIWLVDTLLLVGLYALHVVGSRRNAGAHTSV